MKNKILFYQLLLMGLLFTISIGCDKNEDDNNPNNNNPNMFTDARDGNVYKTVTIGNQVWMAENLKYLPNIVGPATSSGTSAHYYVYGYDGNNIADAKTTVNYSNYGVLYNWEAAKTACPAGWHLPSLDEWEELEDYLGGISVAGIKLQEIDTTTFQGSIPKTWNETGFTALQGGCRTNNGTFSDIGSKGFWWCGSSHSTYDAMCKGLGYNRSSLRLYAISKEYGFSVRCIKD